MEEFSPTHKTKKKSLYVFAGLFIVFIIGSIYVTKLYLPIELSTQNIALLVLFSLFMASIGMGFHHKKLKFAHVPMMAGLVMSVIGGSLGYGAVNPTQKLWEFPPQLVGFFALITLSGLVLFGYGVIQSWKKVNL